MRQIRYILCALLTVLGTTATIQAETTGKGPKIMPQTSLVPSALLLKSYRYMGGLKQFSIKAVTTSDDLYRNKMAVTYIHEIEMDVNRPDKLYIQKHGDLKNKAYYINAGNFTVYDEDTNYYGRLDTPKSIDKALDFLFEKYHVKTSLANILYTDLDRRIPPKEKGVYFGISEVEGVPCHHIGFSTQTQEYQVWIEQGERPLIRMFIITDKSESYHPRSMTVLHWDLKPAFDENHFLFEVPKNAIQIDIEPIGEGK